MAKIKVENTEITVVSVQNEDYISLTDMAHSQMQEHIVFRWMSLKSTIEYLGEWEMLYNPNFNCTEFDTIRNAAGSNNFVLSVKAWIERTGAIGIMAKAKPIQTSKAISVTMPPSMNLSASRTWKISMPYSSTTVCPKANDS